MEMEDDGEMSGRWLHGEPEVCVQIWEEDGAWRRWVVRDEEEGDGRWMEEMGRRGEMEKMREMESPGSGMGGMMGCSRWSQGEMEKMRGIDEV
ncbi:hypothetical protein MRB53_023596 [Persea americana]|uniref:Uncharacterized protein n=1 Tax=Persea americana TaxID=3435 RepID=A0ACC2LAU6_PERAE|nr:hypothetical protein MRB53_023596 [Persea americana]